MIATETMATQAIDVEAFTGRDSESAPAYNAPVPIDARVQRRDMVVKRPDGTEVRTQYTIYVDGGESPLPRWHDRLTVTTLDTEEERTVIVEEHYEGRDLSDSLEYVRVRCREE